MIVPPISRVPLPSTVTGRSRLRRVGEQRLLRDAALVPQRLQLPGVDAMAFRFEPLLQHARQREVHVVAAEQDVIADRDPLEREIAAALATTESG